MELKCQLRCGSLFLAGELLFLNTFRQGEIWSLLYLWVDSILVLVDFSSSSRDRGRPVGKTGVCDVYPMFFGPLHMCNSCVAWSSYGTPKVETRSVSYSFPFGTLSLSWAARLASIGDEPSLTAS